MSFILCLNVIYLKHGIDCHVKLSANVLTNFILKHDNISYVK